MKLECKMLKGLAGKSYTYPKGSIQQIDEKEAVRLMEAGVVEIIATPAPKKATRESKLYRKTSKRSKK